MALLVGTEYSREASKKFVIDKYVLGKFVMVTIDGVIAVFWSEGGILKEMSTTETELPRVLDMIT
jgi:hypothetical protein